MVKKNLLADSLLMFGRFIAAGHGCKKLTNDFRKAVIPNSEMNLFLAWKDEIEG